jgi:hypothetical protein
MRLCGTAIYAWQPHSIRVVINHTQNYKGSPQKSQKMNEKAILKPKSEQK